MTILVVMPFAGSCKLVDMAADCLKQFRATMPENVGFRIMAVANNPERFLTEEELGCATQIKLKSNIGFGPAVNEAIDRSEHVEDISDVLVINSDLQFPCSDWLEKLLAAREKNRVVCPGTDRTATAEAIDTWATAKHPTYLRQVSAYCWLVPINMVTTIQNRWDFWLFPPQFPNYGSDDAAAAVLRKTYGERVFKIEHRSWVRHLKAKTANELGVKAGTKLLLSDLRHWMSANKLK